MRTAIFAILYLLWEYVTYHVTTALRLRESRFELTNDFSLLSHVIDTIQSVERLECARLCTHSAQCLSANYYKTDAMCELNAKRRKTAKIYEFVEFPGSVYMEKMECEPNVCLNGGECAPRYQPTSDSYRCVCKRGFKGRFCETAIVGYTRDLPANSCKQIYNDWNLSKSGVYYFKDIMDTSYQAYCIMDEIDGCGGGGWSLVMKIDGQKTTFHYNSSFWENKLGYDLDKAGQTGLDTMETKVPFYWSTSFTQLCLGMRVESENRWIKVKFSSTSLYDVMFSGTFVSLNQTVPVSQWRSLLPHSSMQSGFTRSGFNNKADAYHRRFNCRARIGLLGNNEDNMDTPDSRIGFGTGGTGNDVDRRNSCGNEADSSHAADNGRMSTKAFCYILIQ